MPSREDWVRLGPDEAVLARPADDGLSLGATQRPRENVTPYAGCVPKDRGLRGLDSPRHLGGHFTPTLGVSRRTEGGEPSIAVGSRGSSPGASQICVLRCAIVGRLVSNGEVEERDTDP